MKLLVKALSDKIGKTIPFPYYATAGAAAVDLHACIDEPVVIPGGAQALIPTGLAVAIPEGHVGILASRSSMGVRNGVGFSNGIGVIDSDYRGGWMVPLRNLSGQDKTVEPGQRIAQVVFMAAAEPEAVEAEELSPTTRGRGGFGSTGL